MPQSSAPPVLPASLAAPVQQPRLAPLPQKQPVPVQSREAPKAPKHENSKLMKVLEELSMDDFDLPALEPLPPAPRAEPRFEPQMARQITGKKDASFLPIHHFEDTLSELHGSDQHIHNLQVHNERLGMIETHTKNELDSLVTLFDTVSHQLLAIDQKLFAQGE